MSYREYMVRKWIVSNLMYSSMETTLAVDCFDVAWLCCCFVNSFIAPRECCLFVASRNLLVRHCCVTTTTAKTCVHTTLSEWRSGHFVTHRQKEVENNYWWWDLFWSTQLLAVLVQSVRCRGLMRLCVHQPASGCRCCYCVSVTCAVTVLRCYR